MISDTTRLHGEPQTEEEKKETEKAFNIEVIWDDEPKKKSGKKNE